MTDQEFDFTMRYLKALRLVVVLIGVLALAFNLAYGG